MMAGERLRDAARRGDLAMLRAELRRLGRRHVDSGDDFNWRTALHFAAMCGQKACLETLLVAGASVHSVTRGGSIPLYYASRSGHVACVRVLISAGSDVNRANVAGWTPFTSALDNGHRRVLKILLRAGADVNSHKWRRREFNASA